MGFFFYDIHMTKKSIFRTFALIILLPTFALAAMSTKENIFNKEKGFFSCTGASSSPLFKQDCLELTLDRISFGGDIVYEGACLDSNGKKFRLSCANYAFEPEAAETGAKKNYFDK